MEKPSREIKNLFQELVGIKTKECKRRDWAILFVRDMFLFRDYKIINLMGVR